MQILGDGAADHGPKGDVDFNGSHHRSLLRFSTESKLQIEVDGSQLKPPFRLCAASLQPDCLLQQGYNFHSVKTFGGVNLFRALHVLKAWKSLSGRLRKVRGAGRLMPRAIGLPAG